MNYFLLKLAFDTAVHFGGSDSAVGSQSSALTLRADTIFSALCHTALEVYGEPALEELLVSADADALRISDAMPWRGDSFYLPKPIAASTSPAELSTVERKAVKKLAWIPASKFDRYTASLHTGTYPLDELNQSFGQAYEQTKASVTDGAAADDILDSVFRGVQVSDSAPIDNDKLILTGRTLISPLSAARVEDFDGDAKDLPLYQECVRPGETIRFRLTLDQSILNRYAHPITKDALLEAILRGLHILDYNLHTVSYPIKNTRIPGFVGSAVVEARLALPLLELWNALLSFAPYGGIGIKTTLGMGGVSVEPLAPPQRSL